jgi:2-amino-4-hydroxy-6-hydroxymethyldihydropteridine diphosphokinase
MAVAYIGLGSNLGDREGQVLRAARELAAFSYVRKISSLTETDPVGMQDQPKFINAVAEIETALSPQSLLDQLQHIEMAMGRRLRRKGGPREIDLDLLAYGEAVVKEENLEVPHPRMHERRFVLQPMRELNAGWIHPVLHKSVSELLARLER